MYRISIVGAGNVAFRMALFLQGAGHQVECVCARDIEKAEKIVRALKRTRSDAFATTDFSQIPQSDILVLAVSDNAIGQVASQLANKVQFTVHTSGATDVKVLADAGLENYGVFYPLMTLSKNKNLDIRMVPFLIEASGKEQEEKLANLVKTLKAEYNICNSQKRLKMHTAAVFTTNFVNYMLTMAYEISHPDFTFLLPSAIEAVRKAFLHTPMTAQTGPALRKDMNTLEKHMQLLEEGGYAEHLEIYRQLSKCIMERYNGCSNADTNK